MFIDLKKERERETDDILFFFFLIFAMLGLQPMPCILSTSPILRD